LKSDLIRLIPRLERLFVPLVSDLLDEMGLTRNVFDHEIRPIFPNVKVAGVAFTATTKEYRRFRKEGMAEWLKVMIEMLDSSRPGDFFVVGTDDAVQGASWGELMSNAARARGARGVVTDGAVRDVPRILSMPRPFPVFARAYNPADSKGRLKYVKYGIPVTCGGVKVKPGDIIFGDIDGVVCIPKADAPTIVKHGEERIRKENSFRRAIKRGLSVSESFAKYKVF